MAPPPPTDPAASIAILEIANLLSVPMALTTVIRLGVPAAIWCSGKNNPLSASEILPSSDDPSLLQRLLRLLSSYNIFEEHISDTGTRRYSLTSIGETLVGKSSYADYVLQHHQDALICAWAKLHEAVLDPTGPDPFRRANGGVPFYEYYDTDPEANGLMLRAMKGASEPFMERLLKCYNTGYRKTRKSGFDGVDLLVEVGGSSGACLQMIMKKVRSVRAGVNFDLPEVVAAAPEIPRVTHVGGDMFKFIPPGDAIFMKWILMTRTNEECIAILKNCYDALPQGGKLIACEPVLPEETDCSSRTRALLENDIFVMTMYRAQGRGHTEEEFRQLGLQARFASFKAIYLDPFYTVLEFLKYDQTLSSSSMIKSSLVIGDLQIVSIIFHFSIWNRV